MKKRSEGQKKLKTTFFNDIKDILISLAFAVPSPHEK